MADMIEVKLDMNALSQQLERFIGHNRDSRHERERFAAGQAMALKVRIDALRDRGRELPAGLQKDLSDMLLAELEERRSNLTRELRALDSEEARIKRGSAK